MALDCERYQGKKNLNFPKQINRSSSFQADFYHVSDLHVKETFYKEILPSLEVNNFGIQERTLRIIKSLEKSSIALSSISDKTPGVITEEIGTSSNKLTNKRRKTKSPSGSPIEKLRKDSVSSSSSKGFKNESSISINDVMEVASETMTASMRDHREDHCYTFRQPSLLNLVNLNSYGDKFHVPGADVFNIELPNSGYDRLIVSRAEVSRPIEMSQSDFELPDSDYEELENQPEGEVKKNCSTISNFDLPDSDYDEFESIKAEIEKNKIPAISSFEPVNTEEEDVEENDFHNLKFTSTQIIPDATPAAAQFDCDVQEADSSFQDESDNESFADFETPSSDYEPDENYREYLHKLISNNKNKVYLQSF